MARFAWFVLLSTLALEAAANALPKVARRTQGWERLWLAPRDASLKLHLALRHADGGDAIERHLHSISDPFSPRFRQHLRPDQIVALSVPQADSVHDVERWLGEHELLKQASVYGGIYEIDTTVRMAEKLLNTTYFVYTDGIQKILRTERFYLPEYIAGRIDFVTPTTTFPKPRTAGNVDLGSRDLDPLSLMKRATCGAGDNTTPSCIRQAYGINYTARANRTTFAVYATEGASYKASDTQDFLQQNNPPAAEASPAYQVIGTGDKNESSGGIEAQFETALDTQTLLGLAWPAAGILYNRGGVFGPAPGQNYDGFVSFLAELISNKTVPSVVSFSESMPENMVDPDYAKRLCLMMGQVGARGVTLLFSSGDNGPNGDTPSGTHNSVFEPEFPASCPWVTAVGGTTNLAKETAATKSTLSLITQTYYTASGGGFSNLFSTPKYQQEVVSNYTTTQVPASYSLVSGYNAGGRGLPDVSAFSTNFPTVVNGVSIPIGGTSASTPVWAAVVALLNDYEASKGRPSLGFLNPWLYSLKSGLKDITTGGNNVGSCNLLAGCHLSQTLGFNVTVGWDAVTGLGSPIFGELLQALDQCDGSGQRWKQVPPHRHGKIGVL